MSNHFPPVPSDLGLAGIFYNAVLPTPFGDSPLNFTGGTATYSPITQGTSVQIGFNTPGDLGSFDQDTAEAAIATAVTDACQALADLSGVSPESVQAGVEIFRSWSWRDNSGFQLSYNDMMTYPPV
jgi:hypothetical protein